MAGEFTPLKVAVSWLAGTYLLFLGVGAVDKVRNLFQLSVYVSATIACLVAGYWTRMVRYRRGPTLVPPQAVEASETAQIKLLVTLSALYYAVYGVVYMGVFGVSSISDLIGALSDPGSAYLGKFGAFKIQQATGEINRAAQILTLTSVLGAPLVPFLIVYWRRLMGDIRIFAFIGLGLYMALFVSIGTLVGLGNVLIFAAVGYLVARARGARFGTKRRWMTAAILVGAVAFAGYMSYNQSARLQAGDIEYNFDPNPIVERITGPDLARGVAVTAFYPTHGYQGLAYNLETSFHWTQGRGSARALDSYLKQYGFGESVYSETYPRRTEARTGWPALQFWTTIYPWLASDLTYPGAALFMGVLGWWLARWWYESVVLNRKLSLLLLAQVAIVIAYVPANNQLGLSRPNLICLVSLLTLYLLSRMNTRFRHDERRGRSESMAIRT